MEINSRTEVPGDRDHNKLLKKWQAKLAEAAARKEKYPFVPDREEMEADLNKTIFRNTGRGTLR